MRNNLKVWIRALAIAVVAVPVLSLASDLTTPNTFTAGTLIQSAQVNANFAAVQTAVNSKQDAIQATPCAAGQAVTGIAAAGGALTCSATTFAFGTTVSGDSINSGLTVTNTDTTASGAGITGNANGGYAGLYGQGGTYGVYGVTSTGTGVYGEASSVGQAGVLATNTQPTGAGLTIGEGYLQVAGAGANTATTAFIATSTAANSSGNEFCFDNVMTNGVAGSVAYQNLILTVTQNIAQSCIGGTGCPQGYGWAHPVGVRYAVSEGAAGEWCIANSDNTTMPVGVAFNVLVIHP